MNNNKNTTHTHSHTPFCVCLILRRLMGYMKNVVKIFTWVEIDENMCGTGLNARKKQMHDNEVLLKHHPNNAITWTINHSKMNTIHENVWPYMPTIVHILQYSYQIVNNAINTTTTTTNLTIRFSIAFGLSCAVCRCKARRIHGYVSMYFFAHIYRLCGVFTIVFIYHYT